MCYAIPGKVVEIKGKVAIVDYFGEKRNALNEFSDLKIGEYVYAQGGFIVQKLPEKEAIESLKEWEDVFFTLKRLDSKISETPITSASKDKNINDIIRKAAEGVPLRKDEMVKLLKMKDPDALFKAGNKFRKEKLENSCCVHGIIEFSNYCRKNCTYCGIRKENEIKRYRMTVDEIVSVAEHAVNELGFKALVLQSGEDAWYTTEKLIEIIKRIKQRCGVLVFMSIGERDFDCYDRMYTAGARGVLLRFETSNPDIYRKIHYSDLNKRIELIEYAVNRGYVVATGSLIGLPEQTEEDLANDILLAKSLKAEMYSFGPLIPTPGTPLSKSKLVDISKVLKFISVARFTDPESKILVTTALETLDKENGSKNGLLAGANSLMINVTPDKYKELYSIYPNKAGNDKKVEDNIEDTLKLLYSLGRAPTDLGM